MENFNQLREAAMKNRKSGVEKPKEEAPKKRRGQEDGKMVWGGDEVDEEAYLRHLKKTFPDQGKQKNDKNKLN